jgi:hypothetical protein
MVLRNCSESIAVAPIEAPIGAYRCSDEGPEIASVAFRWAAQAQQARYDLLRTYRRSTGTCRRPGSPCNNQRKLGYRAVKSRSRDSCRALSVGGSKRLDFMALAGGTGTGTGTYIGKPQPRKLGPRLAFSVVLIHNILRSRSPHTQIVQYLGAISSAPI